MSKHPYFPYIKYCDMTPESRKFIARQRLGKRIPPEANESRNRRLVFSMVSAALLLGSGAVNIRISTAVNNRQQ
jgi:hypothetical protein